MILLLTVSYFGSSEVQALVDSLRAQDEEMWRCVIIDNSQDADELMTLRTIAETDERVTVRTAPDNLGYLGAARWYAQNESLEGADWVAVTNTDLVLTSTTGLSALAAWSDSSVGAVAPRIISSWTGKDQNPYMADKPSRTVALRRRAMLANVALAQGAVFLSAVRQRFARPAAASAQVAQDIYAPGGAIFFLSKHYFERGGTLDHELFLFGEEQFVAEECRRVGLRVVYVPDISIQHSERKNIGFIRSRRVLESMVAAGKYGARL
jgi:GT2 family glycosyltransferase